MVCMYTTQAFSVGLATEYIEVYVHTSASELAVGPNSSSHDQTCMRDWADAVVGSILEN